MGPLPSGTGHRGTFGVRPPLLTYCVRFRRRRSVVEEWVVATDVRTDPSLTVFGRPFTVSVLNLSLEDEVGDPRRQVLGTNTSLDFRSFWIT